MSLQGLNGARIDFPINGSRIPEHIEARRRVADGIETELAALHWADVKKRLTEILFLVSLFVSGTILNAAGFHSGFGDLQIILRITGTLGTALALNGFILLMDDGMHGILFASQFWNRWISFFLGFTYFISFTAYKIMHIRHHHFLGDAKDPDDYENYSRNRTLVWVMHYVRLILGPYLYIFLIPVLASRFGSPQEKREMVQEYILLIVLYGFLFRALLPGTLFSFWLIPLMLAGYLTAIRALTQHGLTDTRDPFIASRSMRVNRVTSFFMLHENYHLEHHFFPEIPSYNLAKAHALIWPRLPRAVTGSSYLGFILKFFAATWRADHTPIGLVNYSGR